MGQKGVLVHRGKWVHAALLDRQGRQGLLGLRGILA